MADPNNPDNLTVIHTPDGATYSFPNTMSQGDITQALSSHLAAEEVLPRRQAIHRRRSRSLRPGRSIPSLIQDRTRRYARNCMEMIQVEQRRPLLRVPVMYRLSVSHSSTVHRVL